MPKKLCNFGGCHNIIAGNRKYCDEHESSIQESKKNNNKRYDMKVRHERDKQYTMFYHSKEWELLRAYVLSLYNGLDLFDYFIENTITPASTGHHIIEIKEDWNKRLTIENIFPVGDKNHKRIHALYNKDKAGTQKLLTDLISKWNELKNKK